MRSRAMAGPQPRRHCFNGSLVTSRYSTRPSKKMNCATLFLLCLCLTSCLGQGDIEFLTVDVEPVSTSSVRASFMPPNATINYTVQYWFGDMGSERRSGSEIVPVNGQGVHAVVLTDPMPTPGTRVEVQMNSTLNLTYPITVASTCDPPPAAPRNIQSFIDPNGFMSTTWDEAGGEVVQYNMQYQVQNSDDANDITIPTGMTNSNVSNLAIMVLYEVRLQSCLVDTCAAAQGPWSGWKSALGSPGYDAICAPPSTERSECSSACAGIIAGVVVGCFGLLSLLSIVATILCIRRWYKKSSRASPNDKSVEYEIVQSDYP